MTAPPRGQNAQLNKLVAGQATTDQRFEELFRRLDRAEETASEARDTAKELVTILREQNTGERLTEVRNEMRSIAAEMRQDFVAANGRLRDGLDREVGDRKKEDEALSDRIDGLEADRNKVVGVAAFFSWLAKVAPWLVAAVAAFAAGIGLKGGH